MKRLFSISPVVRAFSVFGVVAATVTGVTFAALQDTATLTNNTIDSATAELQVKSSGVFATQDAGFDIDGVVPGGSAEPTTPFAFDLRNNGTTDLEIAVSIPAAPSWAVDPSGSVDDTKVDLIITCDSATTAETFSITSDLDALVSAHATGGVAVTGDDIPHTSDNVFNCGAQVQMDADAFTGTGASSDNFNITFWGAPGII